MTNSSRSNDRILAYLTQRPARMALLVRSKLNGPGHHYGVLLDYGRRGKRVLELQWEEGVRLVSSEEFSQGYKVTKVLELRSSVQIDPAIERAREAAGSFSRYRLLDSNCEHFARSIIEGRRASWQISTLLAVGVALFVLPAVLGRAS